MEQDPMTFLVKRSLLGILARAQQDGATDLVMEPAPEGGTVFRYMGQNSPPTPMLDWPVVVSELAGLAGIRDAAYPKEGIIYVAYSGVRLRWQLKMASQDKECLLHNVGGNTL
jgi:hypothetical protein